MTILRILTICILSFAVTAALAQVTPQPKQRALLGEDFAPERWAYETLPADLHGEAVLLREIMEKHGIESGLGGITISMTVGEFDLPPIESQYADKITQQAYRIETSEEGIEITGRSPQAVFYALQTFDQLFRDGKLPTAEIIDWPDIPMRMIMIDPARQNENFTYYKEVIDHCARHKMNAILCHLTDDQTSALYHEDYPELMHPNAWRPDEVRELVAYAKERYVDLIPEIESLGHSRMFTRMEDYEDYLHEAPGERSNSWVGTDIEGYTNVLCPASPKALKYLQDMYERAAETFDHPWIHIGFDEVDITNCSKCREAFGEKSPTEWMVLSFDRSHELTQARNKKTALWGDMLLHHQEVAEALPREDTIIFDWHYRDDITDESVEFFNEKGYEIVGSPALVCYPHMIFPDEHNHTNIEKFSRFAREHDILGINTTIWIPQRYMSDVLWPGIAFAAAHAWGGSNYDDSDFYTAYMRDFHGSKMSPVFRDAWERNASIISHRDEFNTALWIDEESFEQAREYAADNKDEIAKKIASMRDVRSLFQAVEKSVERNKTEYEAIQDAAEAKQFVFEHLMASLDARKDGEWNIDLINQLDNTTVRMIEKIEAAWDRNRFPDDANKEGLYQPLQHLLWRFKQAHDFHQSILNGEEQQDEGSE